MPDEAERVPVGPQERTALIVVDLQNGTVSSTAGRDSARVVANAAALADAFRARAFPVVFATVSGTPVGRTTYAADPQVFPDEWTAPAPGFGPEHADIAVCRAAWSVFAGTGLHERLRALEVDEVVIVGIATSFGVESSARAAYDLGYSVTVVTDATTDHTDAAHEHALRRVFPALGRTENTETVLAAIRR